MFASFDKIPPSFFLKNYNFSREVNRELRAMIANEEEKRVHLKGIIDKLRTQKNEHSSVIDTLISENDQLSREVLKTEREVIIHFCI